MSSRASFVSLLLVFACSIAGCGGDPPEREMQQAQGALNAARAAGADRYAVEEFAAAQAALTHANEAVEARDYRLALNHALDSLERAQNAAKMAADGHAAARLDADHAITAAVTAIADAKTRLSAAESARAPARVLADARAAIARAEGHLQEARAAFDKEDYASAKESASAVAHQLGSAIESMDAAATPPARRRR